jgi:hypothetical protein
VVYLPKWRFNRDRHDTDFNGVPNIFATYKNAVIAQVNVRSNGSAIVVRRYIYENSVLREEWADENNDRIFDYKNLHDPFGALSEHIPIEQGKSMQ